MIYPNNFEAKIGFSEIRLLLKDRCLSTLGKEAVDAIEFSSDVDEVNEWLTQIREFRRLQEEVQEFPMNYFFDVRECITRLRLEGTHMEEAELFDFRRSLETISNIAALLNKPIEYSDNEEETETKFLYPALHHLAEGIMTYPGIIRRIDSILDKYGKIKDSASMNLAGIRHELKKTEGSISRTLYIILHAAQKNGLVDKDAAPTLRDGRLMIPVAPGVKKKISGIVHDESATGKTVYIEPTEVVEANNRIRELEAEERREIVRILTVFADEVRPHVREILDSYIFLGKIDLVRAKAELAKKLQGFEPVVGSVPKIDWIRAGHPLLMLSLEKQGKKVVPLDIRLEESKEKNIGKILIISGPNAGGKSVCLKTVGLLQYMLQSGLSIPIGDRSDCGMFESIMIDIGDEQSIENDLSTYSSHLMNMKQMMKNCNRQSLLLIDEFGGGTEPTIGGAIAEAVLGQFCKKGTFAVITTHYQNLKHFADEHEGVVNGAMLYDRHEMQALFQLSIGQPGSSFAIEIARKTGIPEEVIREASEIVGSDYIQSDKYLQDIVRDKRYWEGKRQMIHQHEKSLEHHISRYEEEIAEIERQRKEILRKAKEQAEELLRESNKKIENAIREIREKQAEKENTRRIREELDAFKQEVSEIDTKANDEYINRKIQQIQARKERKEKRRSEKQKEQSSGLAAGKPAVVQPSQPLQLKVGDSVRIKGLSTVGKIESIDGKTVMVIFGDMKTKMKADRLEKADAPIKNVVASSSYTASSRMTRETIDNRRSNFRQDIDIRGMRADEALNAVTHFIDDAILVGISHVRILHGTGTGVLRQLVRQYLGTVPNVIDYRDEHVQFGGAGITVVEIE